MSPEQFTKTVRNEVLARKSFNKIFCIGANKTGTTSMEYLLKLYGYKMPNQQEQEVRLSRNCFKTQYQEVVNFVNQYDAFQDMPFSWGHMYVVLDTLFPESKFLLTVREGPAWFDSLFNFHKKIYGLDAICSDPRVNEAVIRERTSYLYSGYTAEITERDLLEASNGTLSPNWAKLYSKDFYIQKFLARNEQIQEYFYGAADKLLILDITKEKNTKRICEFLDIPEKFAVEMPHKNKT